MKKNIYFLMILIIVSIKVFPSYNVYNPKYIQEFDKHSWENIKNLFEINNEYSSMNIHKAYVSEDSVEYTHEIGFLVVTGLLSKIRSIEWDDNQKEEITDFLLQYYNKYTGDPNFQKEIQLLYVNAESFDHSSIKTKNYLWLPYRYDHGYTLNENTTIPRSIINTILELESVKAFPLIEKEFEYYFNQSLENSFYFDRFASAILMGLKDEISKTDKKEFKQALFIMVNNIINRINDPAKKIAMKEKLSYFLEVKEIFEINDQKKAWEHLENKQEILTKPTDISYEDLRKVLWGVYELMRDAYYDIDENVLFELEEKAEGNVKDYYSMMLMTVLKSYGIHGKERKLTESKFEQYKNVIENFAKRTKDSKMKTACENALKIAKNSTK